MHIFMICYAFKFQFQVDQLESSVAFEKQERQSLQIVLENAQRKLESLRKENSELRRQFELQTEDLQTLLQQTEILQKRKVKYVNYVK